MRHTIADADADAEYEWLRGLQRIHDGDGPWRDPGYCKDPWRFWFSTFVASARQTTSFDSWIESRVMDLCRAGDERRLAIHPTTAYFDTIWERFRKHHENLDGSKSYRRKRWTAWRASALKVMYDRHDYQDQIDEKQLLDKIVETLTYEGPYQWDGTTFNGGHNYWSAPIVDGGPDPLGEYVVMVLALIRTASEEKIYVHRRFDPDALPLRRYHLEPII